MAPPRNTAADEDLDDLDDIVTGPSPSSAATTTTAPPAPSARSATTADLDSDFPDPDEAPLDDAALAAELQKGLSSLFEGLDDGDEKEFKEMMEKLMRGENLPGLDGAGGEAGGPDREVGEEELMNQLMAAMGAAGGGLGGAMPPMPAMPIPSSSTSATKGKSRDSTTTPAQPPANFQDAIKASLSKVKESNSTIDQETSAKNAAGASSDPFAAMMAQMAGLEGGEQGMQAMLDEMMGQLMSREVLYEPIKELSDKYPDYLAQHESELSAEDLKRYRTQASVVSQIVTKFQEPGADKSVDQMTETEKERNVDRQQEITDLIAQMNDCGAPPKEIMGEMPANMELGPDGVPKMPEECVIS